MKIPARQARSTRRSVWTAILGLIVSAFVVGFPAGADCHDGSPLILDLNGDESILTTSIRNPVVFDINGDDELEVVGWTFWGSHEGILWVDLNHNQVVDDGRELFGNATALPDGSRAEHGFEALAVYDTEDFGGDGDGQITPRDQIWGFLRIWEDSNHDGKSQRKEITTLGREKIVAIGLDFVEIDEMDGAGNFHRYAGTFVRREHRFGVPYLRPLPVHDVFFRHRETEVGLSQLTD